MEGRIVGWELLTKDVPAEHNKDLDFLISMLDWEANVNPSFAATNKTFPRSANPVEESKADGYVEKWVTYGTPYYSAKELTVLPKRAVTIRDSAAYGVIVTQGYGTLGNQPVSTPSMIRFGEMTEDELFVTADAAKEGVRIENPSATDPLVMLKHFGPGNPDAEPCVEENKMAIQQHRYPAVHNAMWPGLVGKGPGAEPFIPLETMLDLTAQAEVDGIHFDGVDLFLSSPHTSIDSTD